MSKVNEALMDVRRWLCDNLSDGDAGKVCGMLSVVSRHINELEAENDELREMITDVHEALCADKIGMFHRLILASMEDDMRDLGIEVDK